MNEEIEIKMLEDEDGEFYTKTHVNAVDGMDEHIENLLQLTDVLGEYINNPQWKTYNVIDTVEKDAMFGSSGFPCSIREIKIGSSEFGNKNVLVMKTIRVNIRNFNHEQKVAQLPNDFMKNTQVFWARGGDNHQPIMVQLNKNGEIIPRLSENDKNKTSDSNWIYAQFTWIE